MCVVDSDDLVYAVTVQLTDAGAGGPAARPLDLMIKIY